MNPSLSSYFCNSSRGIRAHFKPYIFLKCLNGIVNVDHVFHSMISTLRLNANLVFLAVPEGNREEFSRRGGNYGLPSENLQHQQSITGKLHSSKLDTMRGFGIIIVAVIITVFLLSLLL